MPCSIATTFPAARIAPGLSRRSPTPTSVSTPFVEKSMRTRKGILPDAQSICDLIALYSHDGTLLPRTLGEICENVRDFVVAEHDTKIIGCGALHLYGPHLAEVRSIAVHPSAKGHGTGRLLVQALLREAKRKSTRLNSSHSS